MKWNAPDGGVSEMDTKAVCFHCGIRIKKRH